MENIAEIADAHWLLEMFQTVDVGLVVLTADYKIQVWNGFMENHSGLTPRQVRDRYLFDMFSEVDEEWLRRKCEPVLLLKNRAFTIWEQRPYIFRFRNYRPITGSADFMYQNSIIFPLSNTRGQVTHLCIIIYDVTDIAASRIELEAINNQLKQLSRTDFLTQLNNRGTWEAALQQEFKRLKRSGQTSTILMCDIDNFKRINDTYGHIAGDLVIQNVSKAVKKNLRQSDNAGRYGGEEFAVLLVDTDSSQAMYFAERLRKTVENMSVEFNQEAIQVTISIGLAQFAPTLQEYAQWIDCADKSLYISKTSGKNQTTDFK